MSFLLPHFLKEGRGRLDTYFTRVYNPLWTNPDGFTGWMSFRTKPENRHAHRADPDLERDGLVRRLHPAIGTGTERHDTMSQETHAGRWLGFVSQSSVSPSRRRVSLSISRTRRIPARCGKSQSSGSRCPGRSIPTGRLESGRCLRVTIPAGREDHRDQRSYGWIFEHSVPGLPEAAAKESLSPLRVQCGTMARSRWMTWPTARRTSNSSTAEAWSLTGSAAPDSTRRHASSSSTRRRSRSGAGPNIRSLDIRQGTSTGGISIARPTSSTCCRTSGCRRSFTRARP